MKAAKAIRKNTVTRSGGFSFKEKKAKNLV